MKRTTRSDPDMRDEYDFEGGVRGKYASRYAESNNIVVLDLDVAAVFNGSESVNRALRTIIGILKSLPTERGSPRTKQTRQNQINDR